VNTDWLAMTVTTQGTVSRILLVGDVTASTGKRLAQAVLDAVQRGATRVELDLAAVKFIDSSGIDWLIRCRAVAAEDFDRRMTVVAMSSLVRRVLEVTGLVGVLAGEDPA
jgi:anti-anti-sigma factor